VDHRALLPDFAALRCRACAIAIDWDAHARQPSDSLSKASGLGPLVKGTYFGV
jgi:hypothetical protein